MTTNARPITAPEPARFNWRRAFNVAIVVVLLVGSVAAQALNLTPIAIVVLIAAVFALAPIFAPTIEL